MRLVETDKAPRPGGHYSQAVVHDGTVYVAGQLPVDPKDPKAPPGDAASQARQALENVRAILEAAGSDLDRVLQMTVYVSDIAHWGEVNRVYAEVMGTHRPARAVVPTRDLHYGYLVEIQAVAALREESP
ncbi:MAG: reactive intermediate/imine deaminase [Gemmatimonadota bacterium]